MILTAWLARQVKLVRSRVTELQLHLFRIVLPASSVLQELPLGTLRTSLLVNTVLAPLATGVQLVPQLPLLALQATSRIKREQRASTTVSFAHLASCVQLQVSQSQPAPFPPVSEPPTVFSRTLRAAALTASTVLWVPTLLCSATLATTRMWLPKASAKSAQPVLTASTVHLKTACKATTALETPYTISVNKFQLGK